MKYKLVFFDCDGVLTDDGWRRLDRLFIPREVHQQWQDQFNLGKLTLDQWMENVQVFFRDKGLSVDLIEKIYKSVRINPEAKGLFSYLRANNVVTAIISAGFKEYVEPIANKLHAKFYRANTKLVFDKKGFFKKFEYVYSDSPTAKVRAIQEICERYKTTPEKTLFVGDSLNDLKAFKLTRHGIMYQIKGYEFEIEELEKYAWKKIKHLHEIKNFIA